MEQNYSSIVSTLLAMMDGLDSRGDVVVIGATNRIDNIDPALRRPGRFDREFVFPLPTNPARQRILQIHTQSWPSKPSRELIASLAEQCEGYCGADLRALCTESALIALGRTFPDVYECTGGLVIEPGEVVVVASDFLRAMKKITPAQQRSGRTYVHASPCPAIHLWPLLGHPLPSAIQP
jgi:SpoVK/Ycf46/Vps4 family AAA+-type ATPase